MSYLVLARKYRPQTFADLTGQESTAKILQAAIHQNRIASAYLFSGPRGTGKTTTARLFAKALNCRKAKGKAQRAKTEETSSSHPSSLISHPLSVEPCDACDSCLEITKGSSLDVLELDAASHTQVDKIREVIIDTVAFAPVRDRYKVFVIDEAHMLSHHSFNALLKTLEEPPPHAVFILATTEFHKIPTTIVSRCQRFKFLPFTQQEIFAHLKKIAEIEKIAVTDSALSVLAKCASGAMRDALSLLDQVISNVPVSSDETKNGKMSQIDRHQVEEILGMVREEFLTQFIDKIAEKDAKGVLEAISNLLKEGYDLSYFLKELRESFREMLILKCGFAEDNSVAKIRKGLPVSKFSLEEILRDIQMLTKCAEQMRWNDLPHIVFESFAVRMCQETMGVAEILDRLDKMEGGVENYSEPKNVVRDSAPQIADRNSDENSGNLKSGSVSDSKAAESNISEKKKSHSAAEFSASEVSSLNAPAAVSEPPLETAPESPTNNEGSATDSESWQKVLLQIKSAKPFLFQSLQTASVQILPGKIELVFSRSFTMDAVKRNAAFIEKTFQQISGKKVPLVLKYDEKKKDNSENSVGNDPESETEEDEIIVQSVNEIEVLDNESFEVIEGTPSPVEEAIADEGMKRFLSVFHGRVSKVEKKPT